MRRFLGLSSLCLFLAAASCGDDVSIFGDGGTGADGGSGPDARVVPGYDGGPEDMGPIRAIWSMPRSPDHFFWDLPWPTDLRRTAAGMVDVSAFPNPTGSATLDLYRTTLTEQLPGYALSGAAYLRFSREVDVATLPANPAASIAGGSGVMIVDVDPDSPDVGTRTPAVAHYRDAPTLWWARHTLAVRPVYGIPLASGRTYAVVVTKDVRPAAGGTYEVDADLAAAMEPSGGDAEVVRAREVIAPAVATLEAHGIARDAILSLAVFTTQDATGELIALRDWIASSYPAPAARDPMWRWASNQTLFETVEGAYGPSPIFMEGEIPFVESGGGFVHESDGTPIVQHEFDPRFTVSVPKTPLPEAGYPIVIYQHGTGGDWQSFVNDGTAASLAMAGLAVIGTDQIHHGPRNPREGSSPEFLFFNFLNPLAARNNNRQSALDVVQQARLLADLEIPMRITSRDGRAIRFDPTRIYYFGHSQGGLNGPLFLAIDPTARGAVLSGAGATLAIALIEKTEPISILLAVRLFLELPGGTPEAAAEREHFTYEHPVVSLLSAWTDPSDPSAYAHLLFAEPRAGFPPKSILQTEGFLDEYAPPAGIESLAAAAHIPQLDPVHRAIEALALRGIDSMGTPATANVAGGMATAGLLQYPDEGHFAALRNDDAKMRIRGFYTSLITDAVPAIP